MRGRVEMDGTSMERSSAENASGLAGAEVLVGDHILAYIADYIQQHGYAPSRRNIAQGCQIALSGVQYHLKHLEASGHLKRAPHVARSLQIVREKQQK